MTVLLNKLWKLSQNWEELYEKSESHIQNFYGLGFNETHCTTLFWACEIWTLSDINCLGKAWYANELLYFFHDAFHS